MDFKILMIAGLLNANKTYREIVNRHDVLQQYHLKLLPKAFYYLEVKVTKVKVTAQGQQSSVFFADTGNIFICNNFKTNNVTDLNNKAFVAENPFLKSDS